MANYPRTPLPYGHRHNYPHLSTAEAAIWDMFIAAYPDRFDYVIYDYPLGDGYPMPDDLPEEWRRNYRYLSSYKIDVVGYKDGRPTIIEIKKSATTKALGEIWLYDAIWRKTHPQDDPHNIIITDEERPNVREVAEADGVEFVVVPGMPESVIARPAGATAPAETPA